MHISGIQKYRIKMSLQPYFGIEVPNKSGASICTSFYFFKLFKLDNNVIFVDLFVELHCIIRISPKSKHTKLYSEG